MKAMWIIPLAVLAIGCSQQQQDQLQNDATRVVKQTGEAAGSLTLSGKVEGVLRVMKFIDDSDIHVEAKDGVVTISGSAANGDQKHEILETAKQVKGVDKVVDHLVVGKK